MPEEPANSRTASGIQAHVSAEGKRIALKAGPEPLGLEPSAWARTNGATPELALGSCDPAVWKKSGPMLSRRAGEGGYKRFPPYCKRIVRRLKGEGIRRIPAASRAASCPGKMVIRRAICKAETALSAPDKAHESKERASALAAANGTPPQGTNCLTWALRRRLLILFLRLGAPNRGRTLLADRRAPLRPIKSHAFQTTAFISCRLRF